MTRGRNLLFGALIGLVPIVVPGAVGAIPGPDEEAAERAAAEIQDAKDRANEAAAEYFDAQSEFEQLADEVEQLEAKQAELQQQIDALASQVEAVAVNRFLASGTTGIPLLTDFREPSEQLQADVLVGVATDTSADAMDEYDRLRSELEANHGALVDKQADLEQQQEDYLALQAEAEAQVEELTRIEEQRLEDEHVYLAYLAQQREEQRRREEEAAAAAAAAAAEAARVAEQVAADAAAQAAADAAAQAAIMASAPGPDSASEASGDGAGQGDGGDGGGGGGGGGIICPMAGSSSYADGWGNPRSGGRRHQGVDMMASTGTPLVAVVSGGVTFKHNSLGGNSVWLKGSNGDSYYYAHLSAYEGSSRDVGQGEVIGYVGDTGNARGAPHLHFEVHPGGGAAVNPYPYVVAAGC